MAAPRFLTPLVLAAVAVALTAPTVAAHTSVFSSDGKYRIVVGQLEEPVITGAKTGLDLCFSLNTTAREPVAIDPLAFEVTLVSPSGEERSQDLRGQYGRAGCYQFTEPYVLTEPGQYTVSLTGSHNGTAMQFSGVNAGGAVIDEDDIRFPATTGDSNGIPAPAGALLMLGLAALAAVRRMRA
jgi:MYXO-CTERM domain-containing protein